LRGDRLPTELPKGDGKNGQRGGSKAPIVLRKGDQKKMEKGQREGGGVGRKGKNGKRLGVLYAVVRKIVREKNTEKAVLKEPGRFTPFFKRAGGGVRVKKSGESVL